MKKKSPFSKKREPSEELADFMETDKPVSYQEASKEVWDYIKTVGLQDPEDGRYVKPDEELSPILGKKKIFLTQISSKLWKHLK